jgi:protein-arginine kinase activator protein McsA
MSRPLCSVCKANPAAINYKSADKIRYRKICSSCARKGKKNKEMPAWVKAGYKKKLGCERCNFKAKFTNQIFVFHIDGNLKNNAWTNLRSVCANCRIELQHTTSTWRENPLIADY